MCLVLSWYTTLTDIWMSALLSLNTVTGSWIWIPRSVIKPTIQNSSATVEAKLLYSDFTKLLDTVDCFFDFHEIRESLSLIVNPVIDFPEKYKLPNLHHSVLWEHFSVYWIIIDLDLVYLLYPKCCIYMELFWFLHKLAKGLYTVEYMWSSNR